MERLESTFKIIEAKYRNIKKQQQLIADKIVEDGGSEGNQLLSPNQKVGESLKENYLKVAKAYASYQKKLSQPSPPTVNPDSLEAITPEVAKMAEAMQGSKPRASGLEKLPVPTWDGSRRSYSAWKKEFNHWMNKCSQDKDEQLQCFRTAMPKNFWWTDQVKPCNSFDRAWEIFDIQFADKRKMMDALLGRINNHTSVRGDSKSLTRYAAQIAGDVNDMEDNDCSVTSSSEAPFFMSQLLSKLDPRDNAEFGREMKRNKKHENFQTLFSGYMMKHVLDQEESLIPKAAMRNEATNEEFTTEELTTIQGTLMCLRMAHVHFGCEAKH